MSIVSGGSGGMMLAWWVSVIVLVGVRADGLDNKNTGVSRCRLCVGNTTCDGLSVLCPPDRPLCATVASSPDFESSLTCAAPTTSQCSLSYRGKFHLTCTCLGHLCNAPYSAQLRNELYNFSTRIPENTTVELEMFLNSSVFANVTKAKLYSAITVQTSESPVNLSSSTISPIGPRAEALKHEATMSPDDEDDGEGSGTFDDKVPSAPAAPSSFLPSERNNSTKLFGLISLIVITVNVHIMFVLKYS